jgi:hypothetical protein
MNGAGFAKSCQPQRVRKNHVQPLLMGDHTDADRSNPSILPILWYGTEPRVEHRAGDRRNLLPLAGLR